MAQNFANLVDDPETIRRIEIIRNLSAAIDWEKVASSEQERFKNGECPDCGVKLIRCISSLFHGRYSYTDPKCPECGKQFSPIFWTHEMLDRIPKESPARFIEIMHTSYGIIDD